jgi:hypothetical protein
MVATSEVIGEDETFAVAQLGSGMSLRGSNGKYLSGVSGKFDANAPEAVQVTGADADRVMQVAKEATARAAKKASFPALPKKLLQSPSAAAKPVSFPPLESDAPKPISFPPLPSGASAHVGSLLAGVGSMQLIDSKPPPPPASRLINPKPDVPAPPAQALLAGLKKTMENVSSSSIPVPAPAEVNTSVHGIPNTFESEAEPDEFRPAFVHGASSGILPPPPAVDLTVIDSQKAQGPGSRLINIQAVSSTSSMPPPPPRMLQLPTKPVQLKPTPSVPPPPPSDLDLGTYDTTAGEVGEHRLMIPIANASDRAAAKVKLETDIPDLARITNTTTIGQHLVAILLVEWRVSGEYPAKVLVSYGGKTITGKFIITIKHAKPQPFGLSCVIGSQTSAEVPYMGQLWKAATYVAKLEPTMKEFRLNSYKGTMEAGAKVFPFRVVFTPRDPKPTVALLVVVLNGVDEYTVEITGSVGGFQGRNWGKRSHAQLTTGREGGTD